MSRFPAFLLLLVFYSPLSAEPEKLSALDVQLLLEKIKTLREGSQKAIGARYSTANSAFRSAIQSDSAAYALFVNCTEKVQFEEKQKSGSEFRDWKRRHKERSDSPSFRRALRHQLNWLLLTLQAASEPTKRDEMWSKALDHIDTIFKDAEDLEGAQGCRQPRKQSRHTKFGSGALPGSWKCTRIHGVREIT